MPPATPTAPASPSNVTTPGASSASSNPYGLSDQDFSDLQQIRGQLPQGDARAAKIDQLLATQPKPPAGAGTITGAPATISAQPTGVLPWLKNLEGDIRYGTQQTLPGKALHFLGAQGTSVGSQPKAGEMVASGPLGAVKAAQGVAELPSQPWQGTKDIASGAMQASQVPLSFLGGPGPQQATGELAEAGRAGAYAKLPFVGRLFASSGAAGKNFQTAMGAAKDAAVPMTQDLSEALSRYQQLVDAGGSRSLSVSKFLNRVTDPEKGALTYKEARDFYSNISRLSADEAQRLTPVMKQQIGAVRVALNDAVQQTATGAGVGEQYGSAMKEFAQAARNKQVMSNAAEYALKGLPWLGPIVGAGYELNHIINKR